MIETKMQKLKKYYQNPQFIIAWLFFKFPIIFRFVPDAIYLKIIFRNLLGYPLNLKNPKTFNEKIQWQKLYDRNPLYTQLADKYKVRKYIAEKIGEEYLIPLLGAWDRVEDIDFEKLPNEFVLKCNHDCGSVIICKNKQNFDFKQAKNKLKKCLKKNFYYESREWQYKNIKPRVIAEKYMKDGINEVPKDYKVYCINGKPKFIVIFHDRYNKSVPKSETVYDVNWNVQPCSLDAGFLTKDFNLSKPKCLEKLLELSEILCKVSCQARIDFYVIGEHIYFGEITLSTASGLASMAPDSYDRMLGDMLKLPIEVI